MRLFFKRLLFFLIPIFLILGLAELCLRKIPTSYTIKNDQIDSDAANIEVLILGNSHATYGLDPRLFTLHAFNIASVNQSLYFDKRITLSHLNRMKRLKYVLISIDYHSLYYSDEGIRNIWSYYGYGIDYKKSLPLAIKCSYLYGYKAALALEFIKRSLSDKYKTIRSVDVDYDLDLDHPYELGYVGKLGGPHIAEKDNRERAAFFNDIVHSSTERDSILSDVEDFIGKLKSRDITPILITLPCYGPFREYLDKRVEQRNANDIQAICDKYRIPYWNFFTMPLDTNCFYNCDHVNEKGAVVVSAEVNRRLVEWDKNDDQRIGRIEK